MLIRAYGLHWKRDDVFWGKQKNPGRLLGKAQKRKADVDFRDQRGIYALYDDRYNLVYVGQAGKATRETPKPKMLFDRLKDHRSDNLAERWTIFSWFGTRGVQDDNSLSPLRDEIGSNPQTVLDHMEGLILATADPPKNLRGPNFGGAVRYEQTRDQKLPPTWEEKFEEFFSRMVQEIAPVAK
ncbi:MAG: GIY-YIG nuclease family protein [Deltaproteobacteria bacterium]|nr:GIY-YIG nuclease family protein [Deltaproteobacteria bacterium]